jgi:hypothetical protein
MRFYPDFLKSVFSESRNQDESICSRDEIRGRLLDIGHDCLTGSRMWAAGVPNIAQIRRNDV